METSVKAVTTRSTRKVPRAASSPTPTGSEALTVYARARLADGHRVALPPQSGTRIRLPEGDYELWANSADGWTWQRVTLRSGQRATLRFEGVAQRLRVTPDTFLHPRGWTTMPLRRDGDPLEVLLRGSALRAELVTWTPAQVTPPTRLPQPASVPPLRWPPGRAAAGEPLRGGGSVGRGCCTSTILSKPLPANDRKDD